MLEKILTIALYISLPILILLIINLYLQEVLIMRKLDGYDNTKFASDENPVSEKQNAILAALNGILSNM